MTIETKYITSNFPSIFVDCETCHRVLYSFNSWASHTIRVTAEAVANGHNGLHKNEHHIVTVISESPKSE